MPGSAAWLTPAPAALPPPPPARAVRRSSYMDAEHGRMTRTEKLEEIQRINRILNRGVTEVREEDRMVKRDLTRLRERRDELLAETGGTEEVGPPASGARPSDPHDRPQGLLTPWRQRSAERRVSRSGRPGRPAAAAVGSSARATFAPGLGTRGRGRRADCTAGSPSGSRSTRSRRAAETFSAPAPRQLVRDKPMLPRRRYLRGLGGRRWYHASRPSQTSTRRARSRMRGCAGPTRRTADGLTELLRLARRWPPGRCSSPASASSASDHVAHPTGSACRFSCSSSRASSCRCPTMSSGRPAATRSGTGSSSKCDRRRVAYHFLRRARVRASCVRLQPDRCHGRPRLGVSCTFTGRWRPVRSGDSPS